MSRTTRRAIGLTCALGAYLLGGAGRAAEDPQGPASAGILTPSDAVRLAIERSPEVRAMAGDEAAQEGAVAAAALSFNDPQLRLEDLSTRYADPDANRQFTVGLRWKPPRPGELPAGEQKGRVGLWEAKVKARALRCEIAAAAHKLFAEQALLEEGDELASARVALEERRLAAVESLVALGHRPLLDRVQAMRRLMKARRDAARMRQRLAAGRDRFAGLTGVSGPVRLSPGDPPERDLDLGYLQQLALEHRVEVGLADQRARLADKEWSAERFRLVPWFSFVEVGFVHETQKPDYGEMRIGIDLPFSRWNLRHVRAASAARRARAQERAAAVEVIGREIASALALYREALGASRSVRADAGTLVRQTVELLDIARRDPALAPDDLVDLELAELDERQMALDARYDLEVAAADLCAAAGVERWEELVP